MKYMHTSMNEPFDISQIPSAQTVDELLKAVNQIVDKKRRSLIRERCIIDRLLDIPQLEVLICNSTLKSSSEFDLTESETEYIFNCSEEVFSEISEKLLRNN
ncbi:uncharacterized protein LOC143260719 [Megalopta genalis]|uniref:uncharacterized protein LOC143260719 n=1 Tax=Megalopta genalis TaxID=115081 RepID=UPI003FD2FC30